MALFRKSMLAATAVAVLATTGAPAIAAPTFTYAGKYVGAGEEGYGVAQTYDGHRRRWRHHDRDRVDAGDILTGIGILAGIAIIAGAANDASQNDRNTDRNEPRYDDRDYDQPPSISGPDYGDNDSANDGNNDLSSAVGTCTAAAERASGKGERVSEIRSVTRDGDGWRVEGALASDGFTCAATNGRVDYIRLDGQKI